MVLWCLLLPQPVLGSGLVQIQHHVEQSRTGLWLPVLRNGCESAEDSQASEDKEIPVMCSDLAAALSHFQSWSGFCEPEGLTPRRSLQRGEDSSAEWCRV